jgi:hypothetical protein
MVDLNYISFKLPKPVKKIQYRIGDRTFVITNETCCPIKSKTPI